MKVCRSFTLHIWCFHMHIFVQKNGVFVASQTVTYLKWLLMRWLHDVKNFCEIHVVVDANDALMSQIFIVPRTKLGGGTCTNRS